MFLLSKQSYIIRPSFHLLLQDVEVWYVWPWEQEMLRSGAIYTIYMTDKHDWFTWSMYMIDIHDHGLICTGVGQKGFYIQSNHFHLQYVDVQVSLVRRWHLIIIFVFWATKCQNELFPHSFSDIYFLRPHIALVFIIAFFLTKFL